MRFKILSTGSGMTIQDGGRCGWRRFGVPSGGALDLASMRQANLLLGNSVDAPVLEIALHGARLKVLSGGWLGLAGADLCNTFPAGTARPFREGEVIEFDQNARGVFAYLAVPGGFRSEQWLGSASNDLRNGMGRALRKGSELDSHAGLPDVVADRVVRRISTEPNTSLTGDPHFAIFRGPQFEQFDDSTQKQLIENTWTISKRSDRTGYRLEGPELSIPKMIASEPVLPGSFQVPGNGQPIVTMHDGPTVGGYAKIAILKSVDLDRFAQCAPGTQLTFSWID